jgi:hypothetical protein
MLLFLLSNVALLVMRVGYAFVNEYIEDHPLGGLPPLYWIDGIVSGVCFFIGFALFLYATWMLSYNYFLCAVRLDEVLEVTLKPEKTLE